MQAEKVLADSALSEVIPHHETQLPHTWFSLKVDTFVGKLGEWISWVWPILMGIIMLNVVMRYLFGEGRVEFEELQWHFYSIGFLGALSFCIKDDSHVRVDVLHERLPLKAKAWIELLGIGLLLAPFTILLIWYGLPFVIDAWQTGEKSGSPGGLPYRWLIKSALPLAMVLVGIAIISRMSRVISYLFLMDKSNRPYSQSSTQGGHHGSE
ncbi:TRAP transporter small permease subunit [Hahella ganghwensis]|uniref:TRAP transporter small permease subunit n=1 Tax=Hahella ganghwensis TaxID=286420 RepID=UPI000382B338|nr:TRAP transporter small permease subunit [Hahella ganghwensis]